MNVGDIFELVAAIRRTVVRKMTSMLFFSAVDRPSNFDNVISLKHGIFFSMFCFQINWGRIMF